LVGRRDGLWVPPWFLEPDREVTATPEHVATVEASHTGRCLREILAD